MELENKILYFEKWAVRGADIELTQLSGSDLKCWSRQQCGSIAWHSTGGLAHIHAASDELRQETETAHLTFFSREHEHSNSSKSLSLVNN